MATQSKFNVYTKDLTEAKHNWAADTFKLMLTNTAPVATNTVKANITEIAAGNGYAAGGPAVTIAKSNTGGVETITGVQVVVTAAGGAIGPFRYGVLYNDSQASPAKPLVSYIDIGSAVTLNDGDSYTFKFNNTTPGTINTTT